jgi:hypothetical protein
MRIFEDQMHKKQKKIYEIRAVKSVCMKVFFLAFVFVPAAFSTSWAASSADSIDWNEDARASDEIEANQPEEGSPNQQNTSFMGICKTGRALTTTGIILHTVGLAISLGGIGITFAKPEVKFIPSLFGATAMVSGPVISCAGASHVENYLKRNGIYTENPKVWNDYGWGWLFLGGAGVLAAGSVAVLKQGENANNASGIVIAPIFFAGAVACEVLSEVWWMRCVINARKFISKSENRKISGISGISFSPFLAADGACGCLLRIGF